MVERERSMNRDSQPQTQVGLMTDAESKKPRVLCIAPAWNEGERIKRVVEAVPPDAVDATVVVDDGPSDRTASFAGEAGAIVLGDGHNHGVGAAIRTGIDYAIANNFD